MKIYRTPGFVHRMTADEYSGWVERGQIPAWLEAEREQRKAEREDIWGSDSDI
jgi:hypothetical protein